MNATIKRNPSKKFWYDVTSADGKHICSIFFQKGLGWCIVGIGFKIYGAEKRCPTSGAAWEWVQARIANPVR